MRMLASLMKSFIAKGKLTVIDAEGERHVFEGAPGPEIAVRLTDPSLYNKLVFNPELAAGEAYMDGTLVLEDGTELRDLLSFYSVNEMAMSAHPLQRMLFRARMPFRRWQQSNKVGEAQKNISHHYDLGNDFYKLFLDENMLYSCAYFRDDGETLEQAQRNKLRLLAAKMDLKPGQKVLDIGCGWGDLALYLARMESVEVLGVTLSHEQQELATKRAAEMGLSNQVRFELRDYRQVNEQFDRIVSVGMFEHVGVQNYREYFSKISELMPDEGVAVIHSIGHMSPPGMTSPWIRKYIFPGAYTPAMSEVFPALEAEGLWCLDLEFLRLHYAKTLKHWWERFEKNRDKVIEMYDERFARMWEFYLLGCEMMFRTGSQMVFQAQISKSRDAVPIQRDYITDKQRDYIAREGDMVRTM